MDTFIGQIMLFCGNFAPSGWAFCDGQLVSIAENDTLFALIGTTYGGDGQSTFALPDLRGRVPVHFGNPVGGSPIQIGQSGGIENVTLTINNLPAHNHNVTIGVNSAAGEESSPTKKIANGTNSFSEDTSGVLGGVTVGSVGLGQQLSVKNPFVAINYIISLFGIFPQQS